MTPIQVLEIDGDTIRVLVAKLDDDRVVSVLAQTESAEIATSDLKELTRHIRSLRKNPLDPRKPVHLILDPEWLREDSHDLAGITAESVTAIVERSYARFVSSLGGRPGGFGTSTVISRREVVAGLDVRVLHGHVFEKKATLLLDAILEARLIPGAVISGARALGAVLDLLARRGELPPGGRVDMIQIQRSTTAIVRFDAWTPGRNRLLPRGQVATPESQILDSVAGDLTREAQGQRIPEADVVVILGDVPGLPDVEGYSIDLFNRACRHIPAIEMPLSLGAAPKISGGSPKPDPLPARFARLMGGFLLLARTSAPSLNIIQELAQRKGIDDLQSACGLLPLTRILAPILLIVTLLLGGWRGLTLQGVVDRKSDELQILRSEMMGGAQVRDILLRFQDARWTEGRQDAQLEYLDQLTSDHPDWVSILNALAHQLPGSDISVTHVVVDAEWPSAIGSGARATRVPMRHKIQVNGEATKLNGVTEFIRRLNTTNLFEDLQIQRSERIDVSGPANERLRLFEFTIAGFLARHGRGV